MSPIPFSLETAPGLEAVKDAFIANFDDGLELGAGFAAYRDGECIVDLIGGWADKKKITALSRDHLIAVFSSGKAMAALAIAHLTEEDMLGYNQPVGTIWKEFNTYGKGDLTVAQVLSHQAGLAGITNPEWTKEDWFDWDKTCRELALQEPLWEPGTACGYHPVTFGFLAGEIARRADLDGRHLGTILREDICEPHDLDIWIGLPESEHARCADMARPRALADFGEINSATRAAFLEKWSSPGGRGASVWRSAQLAGSNCHATAKSLAKAMSLFIQGTLDQIPHLSEDTRTELTKTRIGGPNLVLPFEIDFAAGVMKNTPNFFFGPNAETIGHSGWGGSCVFADPVTGISGAYAMTRQDNTLLGDRRPRRVIETLYRHI